MLPDEALSKCVEGRRADVAVDDPERAERELGERIAAGRPDARPVGVRMRVRVRVGGCRPGRGRGRLRVSVSGRRRRRMRVA